MLTFARVRAITIVAALFVAAVVSVSIALDRDADQAGAQETCPPGAVPVDLALPAEGDVKINVYNSTDEAGLANLIGDNFANREFQVLQRGDHDEEFDGIAQLRFGPKAVAAAHVVGAYFLNQATLEFDLTREDDVVDVILGSEFRRLATPTDVNLAIAALAQTGQPTAPPGTCPVSDQ